MNARPRPWTADGLACVFLLNRGGRDLVAIAEATGRTSGEVDRALWELMGRTPEQALTLLNGAAGLPDQLKQMGLA
jgi:hypothetical protein